MKFMRGLQDHDPTVPATLELPVGEYLTELIRVDDGSSADGKHEILKMFFKVVDGIYEGRWTFLNFIFDGSDDGFKKLTVSLFHTFGLNLYDYPNEVDVTALVQQFISRTFVLTIKEGSMNPRTGKPFLNTWACPWDGTELKAVVKVESQPKVVAIPTPAVPLVAVTPTITTSPSFIGDTSFTIDYSKSNNRPEGLIHKSRSGIFVRSKNEMAIADLLWSRQIRSCYEPTLRSSGSDKPVQPDFLVMRRDDTLIYWEHCGRMADPEYRARHTEKLGWYSRHGVPSVLHGLLLVTEDSPDHPLSMFAIESKFDQYYTSPPKDIL